MPRRTMAFAVALISTVACAKDTSRPAPAASDSVAVTAAPAPPVATPLSRARGDAAPPTPRGREACRVKFTGAEEGEFIGTWFPLHKDDSVSAASDYWATEAEMRTALRDNLALRDAAEVSRQVEEHMQGDPRVVILELHCAAQGGAVVIVSSAASKYADIPFKPGTYTLGAGTVKTAPAGEFVVVRARSATTPYTRVKQGTLTLTRFDATGVAGSFSFGAESASTKVPGSAAERPQITKIEGTFDLPCEPNRFGQCQLGG